MLTPTVPSSRAYARTLNRIGWALVIFILLFDVMTVVVDEILFPEASAGGGTLAATAAYGLLSALAYMLPFIAAGLLFFAFSRGERTERLQLEPRLPAVFPLLVLAGLAVNLMAAYANGFFCDLIGYTLPSDLLTERYDNPGAVILYMGTALAPAFSEEFLFRGVIYGNLRPYGRMQATFVSALLFALMHQNIGQIFYTFICGIIMAVMYEYTGSIWCGIIYHMINNELAVISEVLYYGTLVDSETASTILTMWDCVVMLIGLASVCLLCVLELKRQRRAKNDEHSRGTDGKAIGDSRRITEPYDQPLSRRVVLRSMCAPGFIVFTALTVLSMMLTYLMILAMNQGLFM